VWLDGEDVLLDCTCGRQYRVHSQKDHLHVFCQSRDWTSLGTPCPSNPAGSVAGRRQKKSIKKS
jgi:hypothetical protein